MIYKDLVMVEDYLFFAPKILRNQDNTMYNVDLCQLPFLFIEIILIKDMFGLVRFLISREPWRKLEYQVFT